MPRPERLVGVECLPQTLWLPDPGVLLLPSVLARAYRTVLESHGLCDLATSRAYEDSPIGGLSQDETDKHLAQAFSGSTGRAQLAILDPRNDIPHVSNAFIRLLSGEKLSLVDAPCGAGAASLAFVATVCELRAQYVLPRQPIEIALLGAELSAPARVYAGELLDHVRPIFAEQGITIVPRLVEWDALDKMSTTALVTALVEQRRDCPAHLLVVANFSGFLHRQGKRKDAQAQLEELFRYSYGRNSTALWLEPQMNAVIGAGGLFGWLSATVRGQWSRFSRLIRPEVEYDEIPKTSAFLRHPLRESEQFVVRLAVERFDLDGTA